MFKFAFLIWAIMVILYWHADITEYRPYGDITSIKRTSYDEKKTKNVNKLCWKMVSKPPKPKSVRTFYMFKFFLIYAIMVISDPVKEIKTRRRTSKMSTNWKISLITHSMKSKKLILKVMLLNFNPWERRCNQHNLTLCCNGTKR